ncbi:transcription initiation factor TFIID subunit 8-like [Bidens hawaiensis]|uniref:transcription initiation factor TFIID subunit 8-like n=1 Tax=Bidens hawaiensis TaxID=980011 RepID=UPI00404AD202
MKMKSKKKKLKASSSESHTATSSSSPPPDLHTAAVKLAMAQICTSIGYKRAQSSALEILASITVTYIQSLAKSASTFANFTGRTECNLYDVIRALDDVHYDVGFDGNSDVINRRLCNLSDSSILRDVMRFVRYSYEIPFAKPLPRRRIELRPNPPCFGNESVKLRHIPMWLPEFPKLAGAGEITVEGETESEVNSGAVELVKEISKLPEKRKKVRFTIGGRGGN